MAFLPKRPVAASTARHQLASRGASPPINIIGEGAFGTLLKYQTKTGLVARKIFKVGFERFRKHELDMATILTAKCPHKKDAKDNAREKCFLVHVMASSELPADFYECHGFVAGQAYIDYEFLDGQDLSIIAKSAESLKSVMKTVEILCQFINALLNAVRYIHSQEILHLDIKPANIFYTKSGRTVLLDYGISQKENSKDLFEVIGTNGYQPPEWWGGDLPTQKFDVFSLGASLYEILYGSDAVVIPPTVRRPAPDAPLADR